MNEDWCEFCNKAIQYPCIYLREAELCGNNRKVQNEDLISNPSHYADSIIEAKDYIRDRDGSLGFVYFFLASTRKYLHRYRQKGSILENLKKAHQCLGWVIEELEANPDVLNQFKQYTPKQDRTNG